jgi:hypothetical protein
MSEKNPEDVPGIAPARKAGGQRLPQGSRGATESAAPTPQTSMFFVFILFFSKKTTLFRYVVVDSESVLLRRNGEKINKEKEQ